MLELTRCEYVERRENVLLIGGSGTGKTHLATALAAEACARENVDHLGFLLQLCELELIERERRPGG